MTSTDPTVLIDYAVAAAELTALGYVRVPKTPLREDWVLGSPESPLSTISVRPGADMLNFFVMRGRKRALEASIVDVPTLEVEP